MTNLHAGRKDMVMDPSITYFPVGNGDTTLIELSDGCQILIDCNITTASEDEADDSRYDVRTHLLSACRRDKSNTPHLDAFILTHPDQDHCRGFDKIFYLGKPSQYGDSHKKQDLIIIDELWFAPRIFWPHDGKLCDNAKRVLKEAKRRIEVFRSPDKEGNKAGNRIRIIGYSDNEQLKGLDEVITVPGNEISVVNGDSKTDFSFFVHGPFKKDTDSEWSQRNDTSIVLHARFSVDGVDRAGLAFFGGDAEWPIWEAIVDRSDDNDLKWDLFFAPHHCSWTFFNDVPQENNPDPQPCSLDLLKKKTKRAVVVASCKPIEDDDDNPPHHAAKEEYVNVVGSKFFVTMEYPNSKKTLPLRFEISAGGPVKIDPGDGGKSASLSGLIPVVGRPQRYGR